MSLLNKSMNRIDEIVNAISDIQKAADKNIAECDNLIQKATNDFQKECVSIEEKRNKEYAELRNICDSEEKEFLANRKKVLELIEKTGIVHSFDGIKAEMHELASLQKTGKVLYNKPLWFSAMNAVSLGMLKKYIEKNFSTACHSGIRWYDEEILEIEKSHEKEFAVIEANAKAKKDLAKQRCDERKKQLLEKKTALKAANTADLYTFATSTKVNIFCSNQHTLSNRFGMLDYNWNTYEKPESGIKECCLGATIYPGTISAVVKSVMESYIVDRIPHHGQHVKDMKGLRIPFSVPLKQNIAIEYSDKNRAEVMNMLQNMILRLVRTMPPKSIEFTIMDPIGRGGSLGNLIKLSKVAPYFCPLCEIPADSKQAIQMQMVKLLEKLTLISQSLANVGTIDDVISTSNFDNEEDSEKSSNIKHNIIIIEDFAEDIDASFADLLKDLTGEAAKKAGYTVIIANNKKYEPKDQLKLFYEDFKKDACVIFEENENSFCSMVNGHKLPVIFDNNQTENQKYIDSVYEEYIKPIDLNNSVDRFYPSDKPFEFKNAKKALKIPFAVNSETNEIVEMELGGNTTSFAMITGTQGSGKSSTLHAIITGLMTNYHPDDVELWLVDYKMTEFSTVYADKNLPHIKFLGIENSPEFTYGILDKIKEEFDERRLPLFKEIGVKDLKEYMLLREEQIQNNGETTLPNLPRIVLIIDEMSNLAKHISEEPDYKDDFEHMIRTYRAPGLCAIFADQYPIANSKGITSDAQNLIMTRMAMAHTLQDMKDTLMLPGNFYTEELINNMSAMSAGDIVYKYSVEDKKTWKTTVHVNKYKSVYLSTDDLEPIFDKIRNILPEGSFINKNCVTIRNSERVVRDEEVINAFAQIKPLYDEENIPLYLGTPTSLEKCFRIELSSYSGQNILIVSPHREMSYSTIINTMYSFLNDDISSEIVVLAHPKDKLYKAYKSDFYERFEDNERVLICTELLDVCKIVSNCISCVEAHSDANKTLLVFFGLHEWFEDFSIETNHFADIYDDEEPQSEANITEAEATDESAHQTDIDAAGVSDTDGTIEGESDETIGYFQFLQDMQNNPEKFAPEAIEALKKYNEQSKAFADASSDVITAMETTADDVKNTSDKIVSPQKKIAGQIHLDAREEIMRLLQAASRYNIFSLIALDNTITYNQLKLKEENFAHKILGTINKSDAYTFGVQAAQLAAFTEKRIAEKNLLYVNSLGTACRFLPYSTKA